jgi:uncharacterized membrane protein YjjB (DUF3815 family)
MNGTELLWLVSKDAFWSGVAALGFAMLFNVPVRTLGACFIAGAVGHGTRAVLMHFGVGIEAGTLVGSVVIGFLGVWFGRIWQAPAPVFTVPGAITMVPGSFAFRTMLGILEIAASANAATGGDVLWTTSVDATKTALILGAIAVGIAAPSLLFHRQKPVV